MQETINVVCHKYPSISVISSGARNLTAARCLTRISPFGRNDTLREMRSASSKSLMHRALLTLVLYAVLTLPFPSAGSAADVVVASTSLTAAIATAAGAEKVRVMTPQGLKHPPEYELKPSDLLKFEGATVVVYAGYERMVTKLLETSRNQGFQAVQVNTDGSPESLIEQVRKTAKVLRTEEKALSWEKGFHQRLGALANSMAHLSGKRAIVHRFAEPFARWAGLGVVQIIRPGEITPRAIADAIAQSPEVVVDVLHFPVAKVIAENAGCRYVQIINFPGAGNTHTLEDLFEYNTALLLKAFQ
jgi:zinc transport system substrate-binding protein